MTSTSSGIFVGGSCLRTRARTLALRLTNSLITSDPTLPVPPVTRTFIAELLEFASGPLLTYPASVAHGLRARCAIRHTFCRFELELPRSLLTVRGSWAISSIRPSRIAKRVEPEISPLPATTIFRAKVQEFAKTLYTRNVRQFDGMSGKPR